MKPPLLLDSREGSRKNVSGQKPPETIPRHLNLPPRYEDIKPYQANWSVSLGIGDPSVCISSFALTDQVSDFILPCSPIKSIRQISSEAIPLIESSTCSSQLSPFPSPH